MYNARRRLAEHSPVRPSVRTENKRRPPPEPYAHALSVKSSDTNSTSVVRARLTRRTPIRVPRLWLNYTAVARPGFV